MPRAVDPLMTRVLDSRCSHSGKPSRLRQDHDGPCTRVVLHTARHTKGPNCGQDQSAPAAGRGLPSPSRRMAADPPDLESDTQRSRFSSEPGRFILTGSAIPAADPIRHTGAARFIRVRQRTTTWKRSASSLNPQLSTTCSSTRRPWAHTYTTIATPTDVRSIRS